jgi:hypothetical protein
MLGRVFSEADNLQFFGWFRNRNNCVLLVQVRTEEKNIYLLEIKHRNSSTRWKTDACVVRDSDKLPSMSNRWFGLHERGNNAPGTYLSPCLQVRSLSIKIGWNPLKRI